MSAQSAIFNPTNTTSAATGDGFSVPRLTTTGRLAITFGTSDAGMMVFDTTLNNLFIWTGAAWESVPASGDAGANGSVQYNDNGVVSGASNFFWDKAVSQVGIRTSTPGDILEVVGSGSNGIRVSRAGQPTQYTTISAGATGPAIDASSAIGALTFGVAGSTKATIDSSGNLGLGVTPSAWSQGKALELGSKGNSIWGAAPNQTIITANSYYDGGWKYAANGTATNYEQASGNHFWYSAVNNTLGAGAVCAFGAAKMALDPSGNLAPVGNLVPASGKGIDFSATPQPAGMTSELLNDYEEGTFTPTVRGSTSAGTGTYTTQFGRYTKVGRLVTVTVQLVWTAHTGTGNLQFASLPFTSANEAGNYNGIAIAYQSNIASSANTVIYGLIEFGSSVITMTQTAVGGGGYGLVAMDTAGEIAFTATYYV